MRVRKKGESIVWFECRRRRRREDRRGGKKKKKIIKPNPQTSPVPPFTRAVGRAAAERSGAFVPASSTCPRTVGRGSPPSARCRSFRPPKRHGRVNRTRRNFILFYYRGGVGSRQRWRRRPPLQQRRRRRLYEHCGKSTNDYYHRTIITTTTIILSRKNCRRRHVRDNYYRPHSICRVFTLSRRSWTVIVLIRPPVVSSTFRLRSFSAPAHFSPVPAAAAVNIITARSLTAAA